MVPKRKTGDEFLVHETLEQESDAKKRRLNPPRSETWPRKTRKKKVADPVTVEPGSSMPQAGPSQPAASAAKMKRKEVTATEEVEALTVELESFSTWRPFAESFGLRDTLDNNLFEQVLTPVYWLPPSIHEIMFETAWHTQDVYQERQVQRREAARVRFMDPYLVRIIGLFQGRVIEQDMLGTGDVEHEIVMMGGILFLIAEFKLDLSLEDNVAQLFLGMLSAARANKTVDFAKLSIYGLLTDLIDFHFYSYDPLANKFAFDETLVVNITRDVAFTDMIPVANKIFGVILIAYIDGLEATLEQTRDRIKKGDVSGRKSTDCWEAALQFAEQCRDKFKEEFETIEHAGRNSTAALEMLAKSVRSIPRVSRLTGADDPFSLEDIKALAHSKVHKKLLDMIDYM